MKRSLLAVLFLTGIFSSRAAVMVSTDPVPATMNEHFVITLPTDQALAQVYVVDITNTGFKSEEQLQEFCSNAADNVLMIRGNFQQKKLFISPQTNMTDGVWTIADWNKYLETRAVKLEALFKMVTAE